MLLIAALAACSDDGGEQATPTTTIDSASVRTFTSQEVCELLPAATVTAATGLDVLATTAESTGPPACTYQFEHLGELQARVPTTGFDVALERASRDADGAEPVDLPGVGDEAAWVPGGELSSHLVAFEDGHVVEIVSSLNQEQAAALALELFRSIEASA